MKRLLTFIAAAALMLAASVATASVTSTGHDFSGNPTHGLCEICHVPHAASTGVRLWRATVVFPADVGTMLTAKVGSLCGTCHLLGKSMTGVTNTNGDSGHDQTTFAYAVTSHRRSIDALTNAAAGNIHDAFAAGQTKPYTTGYTYIDCTSCHNPHDPTVRPFLRPGSAVNNTISGVCADCHNRYNTNVGALNSQTWNGVAVSMHPVDVAYNDIAGNGATTFRATPDAALTHGVATLLAWSLGGKFSNSANLVKTSSAVGNTDKIGCQTCHAVHSPAAGPEQATHLLAISNVDGATAALCEGCHGGPANGSTVGGAALGDHPIDATLSPASVTIDLWYNNPTAGQNTRYERTADANHTYWPRGGFIADATKTGGQIICVSCHSAHAGRPAHNLTRRLGPVDDVIGDFCLSCHSDASPLAHHSNTANWPGKSAISCSDCHGALGSGAHNGFAYTRNGPWVGLVGANPNIASQLCLNCHGNGVDQDPFTSDLGGGANGVPNGYLGAAGSSNANHVTRTHYMGTFTDGHDSINTKKTTWNGVGYSKYGGTETHGLATDNTVTPNLICESCHSVLGNMGRPGNTYGIVAAANTGYNNNLLLQDFKDDGAPVAGGANAVAASAAVGSGFCIGCHNQSLPAAGGAAGTVADSNDTNKAIAPLNMHPMTGWSITKAVDAGRASHSLITTPIGAPDGTYADNASRTVRYPGDNLMTCDTCHRPHNAAGGASATDGTWNAVTGRTGTPVSVILEKAGPTSGRYDALCQDCHAY